MDIAIPELKSISHHLASLEPAKKPKMLVVDDEPDNLDLLYRTFRRDFQVLRAESGIAALEILSKEGEVAVIISDQRMPEMKGTEFLSKTVPEFPDTMRIILTGFTDVEDLVEAINSGQVYKYITKPWDPNELKAVVQRAAETYQLLKLRTEELRWAQRQMALVSTIMQATHQESSSKACLQSIAAAFGNNFMAESCLLQIVEDNQLADIQGTYCTTNVAETWLEDDPLIQTAILEKKVQFFINSQSDQDFVQANHYINNGVQTQLVLPISFHNKVLGVLIMRWAYPNHLKEDEFSLLHLAAQQVSLALTCNRLCYSVV